MYGALAFAGLIALIGFSAGFLGLYIKYKHLK